MATILLVEDTKDLAKQIEDILQMEGHHIQIAFNGKDALISLQEETIKPDVIITDVVMPELDGFGLIEQLNQSEELKKIPIIVLSAKSDKDTVDRASALAVKSFLAKPCPHERLIQSIHTVLTK
jgi:PleD family two-component response regulator